MSKSNPVHIWRSGHTTALIFTQKWLNRAKTGVLHGTLKNFPRSNKSVSRVYGTQLTKINWKIKNISSGLVTRRLYFFQKRATFWPKFTSWGIWPICDFLKWKEIERKRVPDTPHTPSNIPWTLQNTPKHLKHISLSPRNSLDYSQALVRQSERHLGCQGMSRR